MISLGAAIAAFTSPAFPCRGSLETSRVQQFSGLLLQSMMLQSMMLQSITDAAITDVMKVDAAVASAVIGSTTLIATQIPQIQHGLQLKVFTWHELQLVFFLRNACCSQHCASS